MLFPLTYHDKSTPNNYLTLHAMAYGVGPGMDRVHVIKTEHDKQWLVTGPLIFKLFMILHLSVPFSSSFLVIRSVALFSPTPGFRATPLRERRHPLT